MSTPRDLTADLGLLAVAAIWGVNFTVVKGVLQHVDPLAVNALRFPLSALVLALVVARMPHSVPDRSDWLRIVLLGLLGHVAYQMCFIFGVDATLAGNASLLLATAPVWTVLLSVAMRHEEPNALVFVGSAGTLMGMALVVVGGAAMVGWGWSTLRGDALMALAAVLWALYTVGSGRLVRKYGVVRMTAWTVWVGTPFLVAAGAPSIRAISWSAPPLWVWGGIVYAGLFAVGIAYLLWYRGLQRLGNSRTAIYQNLVPVAALLTAWLWLDEVPSVLQLGGAAVILGGISLARWGGRRAVKRAPA